MIGVITHYLLEERSTKSYITLVRLEHLKSSQDLEFNCCLSVIVKTEIQTGQLS